MTINLKELLTWLKAYRPAAIERGNVRKEYSTHSSWLTWGTLRIKVLSSEEAADLKPNSKRPHRIFVWDEVFEKWQYAGKYEQHCRVNGHKEKK